MKKQQGKCHELKKNYTKKEKKKKVCLDFNSKTQKPMHLSLFPFNSFLFYYTTHSNDKTKISLSINYQHIKTVQNTKSETPNY